MSKARNLANLLDANGDVASGALDNVPPSNDASALTTGTLPVARVPYVGRRNLIINGDMRIDQRNAGASVSTSSSGAYNLDRWNNNNNSGSSRFTVQQNAGSITPPAGFANYLGCTSTGAYSVPSSVVLLIRQQIEGYNIAHLSWGTANAKSVALSFWVYSSLTGTFGGSVKSGTSPTSYPFTYTINSANTWEQKTIAIPGPTSGTWNSTTSTGVEINLSLGVGSQYSGPANTWAYGSDYRSATGVVNVVATNGATFYITGVQLEVGSVATPFEHRSYGEELALCQRYFYDTRDLQQSTNGTNNYMELQGTRHAFADVVGYRGQTFTHPVVMRTNPTVTFYNPNNSMTSGQVQFYAADGSTQNFNAGLFVKKYAMYFWAYTGVTVGSTGQSVVCNVHWMADAEL
jgi:hypothetical protein